jgi:hypothetical protein
MYVHKIGYILYRYIYIWIYISYISYVYVYIDIYTYIGTVTETAPRVQSTQELIDKNNGHSSGSKRKSRGDYDLDDPPPSNSDPSVSSSSSSKAYSEIEATASRKTSSIGKPISLPAVIPLEVKQKGWAKGTGFGRGHGLQQWDIAQHTIAQAEKDRLLNHLLSQVLIEMRKIIDGRSTDDPAYFNRLQDVVEKSCLIPLLEAHVRYIYIYEYVCI